MPNEYKILPLMWMAFMVSLFMFLGVMSVLEPNQTSGTPPIVFVLLPLALGGALFSLFGVRKILKVPPQTGYIIRFAVCESTALFAIITYVLGGGLLAAMAFWLLGLVCLVAARPTEDAFTSWAMEHSEG